QPGLTLAPVVLGRPILREGLNRGELHALRLIRDRLAIGPLCRVDASTQFGELRFRNVHLKRPNRRCLRYSCEGRHNCLLSSLKLTAFSRTREFHGITVDQLDLRDARPEQSTIPTNSNGRMPLVYEIFLRR